MLAVVSPEKPQESQGKSDMLNPTCAIHTLKEPKRTGAAGGDKQQQTRTQRLKNAVKESRGGEQ